MEGYFQNDTLLCNPGGGGGIFKWKIHTSTPQGFPRSE